MTQGNEIDITCDDPSHDGSEHVSTLHHVDGMWLSDYIHPEMAHELHEEWREGRRDWMIDDFAPIPNPPKQRLKEQWLDIDFVPDDSGDKRRLRYKFRCECGLQIVAREETLIAILDTLRVNGVPRITMSQLGARLRSAKGRSS